MSLSLPCIVLEGKRDIGQVTYKRCSGFYWPQLCRRVPTEAVCDSMHLYRHRHESPGLMTAEQEASLGDIVKPCLNQRQNRKQNAPQREKKIKVPLS